mmetsp:Transcript_46239/g.145035  ORF Transcript_46239/g.145035 Transcript_46239/m.145035 type:complete len:92 (-) Transcript_46239:687-962(-)
MRGFCVHYSARESRVFQGLVWMSLENVGWYWLNQISMDTYLKEYTSISLLIILEEYMSKRRLIRLIVGSSQCGEIKQIFERLEPPKKLLMS